ncbi:MAG: cohesin domain-containing protein, partial [bacterium]
MSRSRSFTLLDAIGQLSPIGVASSARFAISSGFLARGAKVSALATLLLPEVEGLQGQSIGIPISVSTDSTIGFAQFVVEFDAAVIEFRNAQIGPDATGFTSIQTNANLPFAPTTPGTNENVLVQISGGAFTGANRRVVILNFQVIGAAGKQSPLAFDKEPTHTSLTTIHLVDLKGNLLAFQNGKLTVVANRFDISGKTTYCSAPTRAVPRVTMTLLNPEGTATTTTDASGSYQFSSILQGSCKLTPGKSDDLRGAISGSDVLRVQRVLAFLDPPLTGCAFRAADVTKDGSLSGADAVAMLRFLAFFTSGIGFTGQWVFTPPDTSFTLSRNTTANLIALLLGDVNLGWTASTNVSLAKASTALQNDFGSKAILALPTLGSAPGANIAVPIDVSTDSLITIGQFVVEYDSTVLNYQSVQIGLQLTGFNAVANSKLPFPVSASGTNKNILVQIIASDPSKGFTGANREVVVLNFTGVGAHT